MYKDSWKNTYLKNKTGKTDDFRISLKNIKNNSVKKTNIFFEILNCIGYRYLLKPYVNNGFLNIHRKEHYAR